MKLAAPASNETKAVLLNMKQIIAQRPPRRHSRQIHFSSESQAGLRPASCPTCEVRRPSGVTATIFPGIPLRGSQLRRVQSIHKLGSARPFEQLPDFNFQKLIGVNYTVAIYRIAMSPRIAELPND